MNAGDRPVVLAAVAGAHGVRGEVRLKLFTSSADQLALHRQFEAGGLRLRLQAVRGTPGGAVARFAEIADRTAAEALRGTLLTVPRASLPPLAEGEHYWHDLIGREVATTEGEAIGHVSSVENYGASDLLEITRRNGTRLLVPFLATVVTEVMTEAGAQLRIGGEWLA